MSSDIGSKEIKVVVSRAKAQAKAPKKAKTKLNATEVIRARFISRSNAALREIIEDRIVSFTKDRIFALLGLKFGPWDSVDVTRMDPVLGGHLGELADTLRERVVAEVKQLEVSEKEMREIRAAYEKILKAKVMDQVEQVANERAEAVAGELVERALEEGSDA